MIFANHGFHPHTHEGMKETSFAVYFIGNISQAEQVSWTFGSLGRMVLCVKCKETLKVLAKYILLDIN